ncbi:hypothetical protein ACWCO3_33440, partial [Micromonospora sp. NPDC002411]
FEGVTVAYERTTALRDVTLTIRAGERIAVIGGRRAAGRGTGDLDRPLIPVVNRREDPPPP